MGAIKHRGGGAAPIDLVIWALKRLASDQGYDFENCATRVLGKPHLEDCAAAIVKCEGSLADAAELLGVARGRLKAFIDRAPDLGVLLDERREGVLDRIERSVHKKALSGDFQAEKFILQTLGKDRGYSTKSIIENPADPQLAELLRGGGVKSHDLPGEIIDVTPEKIEDAE